MDGNESLMNMGWCEAVTHDWIVPTIVAMMSLGWPEVISRTVLWHAISLFLLLFLEIP
ncbi:MAG: hypothetical protein Q8P04_02575 [bacterium]|nr:hypothetical protein [bacterium]